MHTKKRIYEYMRNPMVSRWYESHTWDGWARTQDLLEHCIEWAGSGSAEEIGARRFAGWLSAMGAVSGRNNQGRYWAKTHQDSAPSTKPTERPGIKPI